MHFDQPMVDTRASGELQPEQRQWLIDARVHMPTVHSSCRSFHHKRNSGMNGNATSLHLMSAASGHPYNVHSVLHPCYTQQNQQVNTGINWMLETELLLPAKIDLIVEANTTFQLFLE